MEELFGLELLVFSDIYCGKNQDGEFCYVKSNELLVLLISFECCIIMDPYFYLIARNSC
jgi:hypothetical protein